MTRTQVIPALLMVLDLAAAGVYAVEHDVRWVVYSTAAAVLTFMVSF